MSWRAPPCHRIHAARSRATSQIARRFAWLRALAGASPLIENFTNPSTTKILRAHIQGVSYLNDPLPLTTHVIHHLRQQARALGSKIGPRFAATEASYRKLLRERSLCPL